MEKSADAFRTISEVAEMLGVPQHVLRFWETRFSQVKPMKRGGGRRFYRPGDVDLIKGIKQLLYDEGYTIKGVQKLLKDNGIGFVSAIGSGDLAAAEEIARKKQQELNEEHVPDDILPDAKGGGRKFFGLLKAEEDRTLGANKGRDAKDGASLLQEALFELIECKRLLDRARS